MFSPRCQTSLMPDIAQAVFLQLTSINFQRSVLVKVQSNTPFYPLTESAVLLGVTSFEGWLVLEINSISYFVSYMYLRETEHLTTKHSNLVWYHGHQMSALIPGRSPTQEPTLYWV